MIELVILIGILMSALGIGLFFLKPLKLSQSLLEDFLCGVGIGFGFLSYLTFFLGIFGMLYSHLFWLLFLIILIVSSYFWLGFLVLFCKKNKLIESILSLKLFEKILILIILFFSFAYLIYSLVPPTQWDGIFYHLAIPKLYIQEKKIYFIKDFINSNYIMNPEMLFMFCMLLRNDILAQLLVFSCCVLSSLCIYLIGREFFSKEVAIIGSFIFFTLPAIASYMMRSAKSDLFFIFNFLLAFYYLHKWILKSHKKELFLSYIFAGFMLSSKPIFSFVLFLSLILITLFGGLKKEKMRYLIFLPLLSLVFYLPWFIKNLVFTNNPFYPHFYSILGGKFLNLQIYQSLLMAIRANSGTNISLLNYFLHIFSLNIPKHLHNFVTPYFLCLLPFLVFIKGKPFIAKSILIIAFIYYSSYFFAIHDVRLLLVIFALLSLLVGYIIRFLVENIGLKKFLEFWLIFIVFLHTVVVFHTLGLRFPYALKILPKKEYLKKMMGNTYEACEYINKNLSKDSLIFIADSDHYYYFQRKFIIGWPLFQGYIDYSRFKDGKELYKKLKKLKVTHVFVIWRFERGLKYIKTPYFQKSVRLLTDLVKNYSRLIWQKGEIYIYQLSSN